MFVRQGLSEGLPPVGTAPASITLHSAAGRGARLIWISAHRELRRAEPSVEGVRGGGRGLLGPSAYGPPAEHVILPKAAARTDLRPPRPRSPLLRKGVVALQIDAALAARILPTAEAGGPPPPFPWESLRRQRGLGGLRHPGEAREGLLCRLFATSASGLPRALQAAERPISTRASRAS